VDTCFDFGLSSVDGLSSSSSEDIPEDAFLPIDFDRLRFEAFLLPIDMDRFILVVGSSSRDIDRLSRELHFPLTSGNSSVRGLEAGSEAVAMACLFWVAELSASHLAKESSETEKTFGTEETFLLFLDD
jgi:hypothetical protein